MANRIFYNPEGYLEVVVEGDQTYMSFENLRLDSIDFIDKLQKEGKPRLGLIDISKQTNFTPDTNKAAMRILESINYEKVAIFGGSKKLNIVADAIILAMGKSANTKLFIDRASALKWLLEPTKS